MKIKLISNSPTLAIQLEKKLQQSIERFMWTDLGDKTLDFDLNVLHLCSNKFDIIQQADHWIAQQPAVPFMVLSDLPDDRVAYHFVKLGALAFANSHAEEKLMQDIIAFALKGQVWMGTGLHQLFLQAIASLPDPIEQENAWELLTSKEREVAGLVLKGLSNKQIAHQMSLATATVKVHLNHMYKKLGVTNRLALAMKLKEILQ